MLNLLEALMLISFGLSWPFSIYNSYKARSAKGKSLVFLLFILFGYSCGIAAKLIYGNITYVLGFYILDFALVSTDLGMYIINKNIEKHNNQEELV
jgi:hydrogenase/urease accessory protein HupE